MPLTNIFSEEYNTVHNNNNKAAKLRAQFAVRHVSGSRLTRTRRVVTVSCTPSGGSKPIQQRLLVDDTGIVRWRYTPGPDDTLLRIRVSWLLGFYILATSIRSYHGGYRLVAAYIYRDFVVLPHSEIRSLATFCPDMLLSYVILTLSSISPRPIYLGLTFETHFPNGAYRILQKSSSYGVYNLVRGY